MKIYISGITGTGMGPLALFIKDAGLEVCGSDRGEGAILGELERNGVEVKIGEQDGRFLEEKYQEGVVDWFVYTSALPDSHPELMKARELGLKISKRDELINALVDELGLKMVAVAGTHGKTTTTSMLIWAGLKMGLPIAYLVGTTLGFAPSGHYVKDAKYFIYEADEYDRNFLAFSPWLAAITVIDYDHPDIYKTPEEYREAFEQFKGQSERVLIGGEIDSRIDLAGVARRFDATLALEALEIIAKDAGVEWDIERAAEILNQFPGVGRRFERIAPGVFSDYGHHPDEIKATVNLALEEAEREDLKGVVAIYEPHQNTRQHSVRNLYEHAFDGVEKLFWLPTFLTREDPGLKIISPDEFITELTVKERSEVAEMGDELAKKIRSLRDDGFLILMMTAGPADGWLRKVFAD